jgi:hypothetical protein
MPRYFNSGQYTPEQIVEAEAYAREVQAEQGWEDDEDDESEGYAAEVCFTVARDVYLELKFG